MNFTTRIYSRYLMLKAKALACMADDRGDTNFISVVVILALVVVLRPMRSTRCGARSTAVFPVWADLHPFVHILRLAESGLCRIGDRRRQFPRRGCDLNG